MRVIEGAIARGDERDFWLRASVHLQAQIEGRRQQEGRTPYWRERAEDDAKRIPPADELGGSVPPPGLDPT